MRVIKGNNEYVLRGVIRARSPEFSISISRTIVTVGVKTRLRLTVTNGGRGKATGARLEIDPPPGRLGLYAAVLLKALQLHVIEALGLVTAALLLLEAVWHKLKGGRDTV